MLAAPFGFTVPFRVAADAVTPVAACVTTVGADWEPALACTSTATAAHQSDVAVHAIVTLLPVAADVAPAEFPAPVFVSLFAMYRLVLGLVAEVIELPFAANPATRFPLVLPAVVTDGCVPDPAADTAVANEAAR